MGRPQGSTPARQWGRPGALLAQPLRCRPTAGLCLPARHCWGPGEPWGALGSPGRRQGDGFGWDRAGSRACGAPARGGCSLPSLQAGCFICPAFISSQTFTLWDANEPFLGARNLSQQVSGTPVRDCRDGSDVSWDPSGWSWRGGGAREAPTWGRSLSLPRGCWSCAPTTAPACTPRLPAPRHPQQTTGTGSSRAARSCFILFQCFQAERGHLRPAQAGQAQRERDAGLRLAPLARHGAVMARGGNGPGTAAPGAALPSQG